MSLFISVLNMSIAASFLFVLVLLLRKLMRGISSAFFLHLLWLPLLFRMLVPWSLPSRTSFFNLLDKNLASPGGMLITVEYFSPNQPVLQNVSGGEDLLAKQIFGLLAAVWYAGVLVLAGSMLVRYVLLRAKLTRARSADLSAMEPVFVRANKGKKLPVVYSPAVESPLVFGCVHPRITLPEALRQRPEGTELILLHELTHVRRKDNLVLFLFSGAVVLHWFNPFAWIARKLMIQDMEAACDERVLQLLTSSQRVEYAQTLLNWADMRRHAPQYAGFGQSNTKRRIMNALNWKQLPRWAQAVLGGVICIVFACTLTNPVIEENHYLPVSSPLVSAPQKERFRQAASQLVDALENGDAALLADLASMDPAYYEALYAPFSGVDLQVMDARIYCNSSQTAEVYLSVQIKDGGGLYSEGDGTLVATLSQTEYRQQPFVSCLMPQKKYEEIRLLEGKNEAVRLAVRLARNLNEDETEFAAGSLSPVTVARVCMESAMEDKKEAAPFSQESMAALAKEYFDIDGFFCKDPSVYDAASGTYFYAAQSGREYYPVQFLQAEDGQTVVSVESYRDPMSAFPEQQLECCLVKID